MHGPDFVQIRFFFGRFEPSTHASQLVSGYKPYSGAIQYVRQQTDHADHAYLGLSKNRTSSNKTYIIFCQDCRNFGYTRVYIPQFLPVFMGSKTQTPWGFAEPPDDTGLFRICSRFPPGIGFTT